MDEVPTMSGRLLDLPDELARKARGSPSPFGSTQIALRGDLAQLPPLGVSEGKCVFEVAA